jgi:hypothetical protein
MNSEKLGGVCNEQPQLVFNFARLDACFPKLGFTLKATQSMSRSTHLSF